MLVGIDVSSLQPNTDWQQVARTHQFAFIKATEGAGYVNPYFARDWVGAAAAGVIRGAYHFARPDVNSAAAEADYFLAAVGLLAPGDLLVLDLEVGSGDLSGWSQAWLERVAARVGFPPIIYTYPSFITEHGLGTAALAGYSLWYASYQQQWPPTPERWAGIAIWQHSDNAVVPGVAGIVDESYTTLTIGQLRAIGKPSPEVSGGPTVDDALAYYQQLGVKVAADHAVYTVALKPLYDYWLAHKDDVVDGVPVGDLIKPGALVYPEYGAIHGNGQQAACVKLSNRIVGAYLDTDGAWKPYQAALA
jgi:GH25 family lysozyme M1 (1,4-beta-N-acetylmuramidase)